MSTLCRGTGALLGLSVAVALVAGCDDDDRSPVDEPSAAVAEALQDASSAEPAVGVPDVAAAAATSHDLPGDQAAAVLQLLGAHPDALRDAVGPTAPGAPRPAVELDESVLDALQAAGGDDASATVFRDAYLAYLGNEVERTIRASDADWYDLRDQLDEVWLDPSEQVLGALEAGCDQSGDTCYERLQGADDDLQATVDQATYAAMPARLLPKSFFADGERVAMTAWSVAQSDDWQRLHDTTLLPLTAGDVEQVAYARIRSTGA